MKNHKVIVIGLPKTGTSTLAAMLRMLGYTVNGPEIRYARGDYGFLDQQFQDFDAFQDYPWCFEWQRYIDDPSVKYIVLKRDRESWWRSFYESYGKKDSKYLSYSYMNLSKTPENRDAFLNFFDAYYAEVAQQATEFPKRFIILNIGDFEWKDLCAFLNEPLPKTVFGQVARKPHVNKQNFKFIGTRRYKIIKNIKKRIILVIGSNRWHKLIVFLRKNNLIK